MKKIVLSSCMVAAIALVLNACASNEIGNSKDVTAETIYQQYSITYNEGDEKVKVFAQYRFAGINGTTLVLSAPGNIAFDDKVLTVDSSEISGAYYEGQYPVAGFFGKHEFTYTDINLKKMTQPFTFDQFKLINLPAIAYKNKPLQIAFDTTPLGTDDYLEINADKSDSTFSLTHSGLDTSHFVEIPVKELQRQTASTLSVSVTLYKKIPLQNPTKEGGVITVEYNLQPVSFILVDDKLVTMQSPR